MLLLTTSTLNILSKMRQEMKASRESYEAGLKKIMTKDQYAAYTKKQAEREQRRGGGR